MIISDTSCLIIFSKIYKLSILKDIFKEIVIPKGVHDEYGEKLPGFIRIIQVKNENLIKLASAFLDKGEAEVIALALENNAEGVILDDKKGRKTAIKLGLNVIGTLGIIDLAQKKGIIEDKSLIINELRKNGFYIP